MHGPLNVKICFYDTWYVIFNWNWVATRWQLFSTHIHTNNTQKDTKQTIHRTQKYIEQHNNIGRVRAVPRLCGFYPGNCLISYYKYRNPIFKVTFVWNTLNTEATSSSEKRVTVYQLTRIYIQKKLIIIFWELQFLQNAVGLFWYCF
jgi:hypothetical protein